MLLKSTYPIGVKEMFRHALLIGLILSAVAFGDDAQIPAAKVTLGTVGLRTVGA
jgi:hypothetical protein